MAEPAHATVQNMGQTVETLSGGQRQAVAVARAATFATKFVVLDEPTAALGVKETGQVLNLIQQIKKKRPAGDLDQSQYAERVRGLGPHPYRQARRMRGSDHPEVPHADRGSSDHDRSHHAAEGVVSESDLRSRIHASAYGRSRSWRPSRRRLPNSARPRRDVGWFAPQCGGPS